MNKLIKTVRIPECLLVVALGFIGFEYSSLSPDTLILIALFFIVAATMFQNDWRDRVHDLAKGKVLAHERPRLFLYGLTFLWITCASLIFAVSLTHMEAAGILLCMALVGAIYSESRRVPFLPVTIVTLASASPLLLPLAFGAGVDRIIFLFIAAALIIFGRETLHDIADAKVDRDYKQTLPLIAGDKFARITSATTLIVGCSLVVSISPICIIGSAFVLGGLIPIMRDMLVIKVRRYVDIGLVLITLGLVLR